MWKETIQIGFLLGVRQIRHASKWTTGLIIFIMMLTFLNLVAVSGILVGLIEGSVKAYSDQFTGDVFVSTLAGKKYIEKSNDMLATLDTIPGVASYSARYTEGSTIEANYRIRRDPQQLRDTVGTNLAGINPTSEEALTHISKYLIEGEYILPDDTNYIVLGSMLLEQYSPLGAQGDDAGFPTVKDVHIGSRVRVTVNGATKEYIVKGILKTKVDEISRRAFLPEKEFVRFTGRTNLNVNEVSIRATTPADAPKVKQALLDSGIGTNALVRLSREGLPTFLLDMIKTFDLLGNGISSVGLLVSSVTIFIVIFVNAITRRKYIGIMKGIGIRAGAIEFSYVIQSLMYAVVGSGLALIIIYGFLVPFFNANPINFPFSDGILVAPLSSTMIKLAVLVISTLIAGYIPAWMIIKKNTLDSILGR
ncbi:MAG: ABC transporter permease [Candidatus Campbellbacteria bacterium]|nr:ABC transporter permease [Candidatus Campbellbacteria bacterium]